MSSATIKRALFCCEVDQRFIDVHNRKRQNTEAIKKMLEFHADYHFKPVWDGTKENLEEIEAYRVELGIEDIKYEEII